MRKQYKYYCRYYDFIKPQKLTSIISFLNKLLDDEVYAEWGCLQDEYKSMIKDLKGFIHFNNSLHMSKYKRKEYLYIRSIVAIWYRKRIISVCCYMPFDMFELQVYTKPKYRRKGLGTICVDRMLSRSKFRKKEFNVSLFHSPRARQFWESLGKKHNIEFHERYE